MKSYIPLNSMSAPGRKGNVTRSLLGDPTPARAGMTPPCEDADLAEAREGATHWNADGYQSPADKERLAPKRYRVTS